jgi:hypothetical protein
MFRLPVSGLRVTIRQPVGEDDLLLQETRVSDTSLALMLVSRLVEAADRVEVKWSELTITDLEALLLLIRKVVIGDLIETDVACTQDECHARITVSFRISEYLSYHQSRHPRNLAADGEGWFHLEEQPVRFRLPIANDLLELIGEWRPEHELVRRCIQPETISGRLRRRVVGAMAAMAPNLSGEVEGECPECHRRISAYFDVQKYVLEELRRQAGRVYEDVHLLALNYQWSEESILLLPRNRRVLYVELLQQRQEQVG